MKLIRPIRRAQQGFTLLEILMSVGLGSIILASGAQFTLDRVDDIKDQSTAQYQRAVTVAAERFIRDNLSSIAAPLAINGPPTAIQLSTVRAAGYLMAGTGNVNPYRQTPCIVVRRLTDRSTGEPRLEALITTEGGSAIPEKRVPFIAAQGGSYGGYVPATAPTTAQGAYGTWTTPLSNFSGANCTGISAGANRLAFALFFDGASEGAVLGDNVLHRVAMAGRPDLNTMNVALNMGNFDIANAKDIAATGNISAGGNLSATNNVSAGSNVSAGQDVIAGRDMSAQRDVRAQTGNVYGQKVMAVGDSPMDGQTELRRWGLVNPSMGMRILTGAGGNLLLGDVGGPGNGTLADEHGYKEFFYGHTAFSRDNVGTYTWADSGSIALGENTSFSGRKASISFHNAGNSEGAIELASSGARRLRLYDRQGLGLGLEVTGDLTVANSGTFGAGTFQADTNMVQTNNWSYVTKDGASAFNAAPGAAAGSAYLNDVYLRSIGKWASQLDQAAVVGKYINSSSVDDSTGWVLNTTGRTLTIQSWGGSGNFGTWNECKITGYVASIGVVADSVDNDNSKAKGCSISFNVPPGDNWMLQSRPYPANANGRAYYVVYQN
jgi:prepilin-type N-terminal cleavage/methylation domain-containing protein